MGGISNIEKEPALRTADRALALLEFVASAPAEPSVKEAAVALELNLTTCYHLTNTLCSRGYLVKDSRGRLRLGSKVAALHEAFLRRVEPSQDFRPILQDLSRTTGETTYLATWEGSEVVLQAVVDGEHTVRVTGLYIGLRGDAHSRASGKAILAYLAPAELDEFLRARPLPRRTPATITSPKKLKAALAEIRSCGYAVDREEFTVGVGCIAAPYFGADHSVRGAITISAPISRFDATLDRLVRAALRAGRDASHLLGYAGRYPPEMHPAQTEVHTPVAVEVNR